MNSARRPFASVAQAVLVLWMLASFILIGQQVNMQLYQIGLLSLVVSTLSQIAFGNIAPSANLRRSLRIYLWIMLVVVVLFGVSIVLAPWLASLGR
ncbi:MAG: hypothetical protein H3C34_18765 [Caldilineaceae bacterium]|nr:hypothetical protein [Caldilineaceae bacterium]